MATITRTELAVDVLENIGVKAAGQPASAEDTVAVTNAIDALRAEHYRDGTIQWAADEIPDWARLFMRDLVSYEVKSLFGVTGETLARVTGDYVRANQRLYRQTSGKHNPKVRQRPRYY